MRAFTAACVVVGLGLIGSLGCSAGAPGTVDDAREEAIGERASALDLGGGEYSFFVATRAGRGYRVASLNGAPRTCPDGARSDVCRVEGIDLAPTLLGADDAAAVLDQVGGDPRRATLVFVGQLVAAASTGRRACNRGAGKLVAWEVWRAPEAAPLRGSWLHVSHGAKQALVVNEWSAPRASTVARIDFGRSPEMSYCSLVDGLQTCRMSHEGVMEDAVAPAGLLVDGTLDRRGVVHVNQYFLKISVGQARLANGFWYCSAEQAACDDGDCVPSPEVCKANTGHGRGLLVYVRSPAEVVQPWFVQTTQLQPSEIIQRTP